MIASRWGTLNKTESETLIKNTSIHNILHKKKTNSGVLFFPLHMLLSALRLQLLVAYKCAGNSPISGVIRRLVGINKSRVLSMATCTFFFRDFENLSRASSESLAKDLVRSAVTK